MLSRLVRGCIALVFFSLLAYSLLHAATALLIPSRAASSASYTTVAMEREQIVYSSLLTLAGMVLADPEPMLARLVRGFIALAFTACVPALLACTISLIPSRAASSATWHC